MKTTSSISNMYTIYRITIYLKKGVSVCICVCVYMHIQWEIKLYLNKIITYMWWEVTCKGDRYKSQGQAIYKMNLSILSFQKARKLSKIIGIVSKGLMKHLKVAPTAQRWVILSTNKSKNISGLKSIKYVKNPGIPMIMI